MIVEVINTGTELLLGNTLNTHLSFLGQELFPAGLRIERQVTVPDGDAIRTALIEALERADIIIVTGGLGPTTDDITRELTADILGLPLEEDAATWAAIQERFARRGLQMTPRNRRQAQAPRGARVLENPHGTAPGLYIKHETEGRFRHLFLLPGPPRELRPMVIGQVLPILREIAPAPDDTTSRRWLITGLGESKVEAEVGEELLAISGLELGYCARPGAVEIRCIGRPATLDAAEAIIAAKLGAHVAGEGIVVLEELIIPRLARLGKKLATAESCTGGGLANRITNVPGASEVFVAGFVTYANESKSRELGVPVELIAAHGAVSEPVAQAMAEGALRVSGADYALSTTGIAGPGGGTEEKPVGTVYVGIAARDGTSRAEKLFFPTDRATFKELVTQSALDILRRAL
jgi:nicotinamide-nucleotide amidase